DNVVDDIVKLLEYAKAFPQEHLMSAGQLLLNRLSNNVGGVKHFSSTLQHALGEERHFALVEDVPYPTKARSQSVFRSGT
ncbi:MAG: hypothetical protein WB780_00195, partial [Candidatus Acidiferrales bacterium]